MGYILFFLLLTPLILFYIYMTRNFNYWKKRGVVFVPPVPFFGNLFRIITIQQSAGQFFDEIYKSTNEQPYVGFFGLDKPMLLIRDPDIIKNILVKDFNFFNDRQIGVSPDDQLGHANLFIIKNPAWKYVRSKISPIYTSARLKLMFERMMIVLLDLDKHLDSFDLTENEKSIEVKEICAKLTTDMMAIITFGLHVNCLNNPDAEFRKTGKIIFKPTIYRSYEWITRVFAPHLMKLFGFTFFGKKAGAFLRNVLWSTIIERENSGQKINDLVDLLIDLKNNKTNNLDNNIFEFDGDNLTAQAGVLFGAGFHTTSSLLSCCLYELALHPECQNRVRQEVRDVLDQNNGEITYEMMKQLPYCDMVLNETLRKYPVMPFLDRIAADDYKVPDHNLVIKKGTPVFIPISGIQMDSKYFEKPDEFDPRRFSSENKKPISGTFIPFGIGPHACIGLRLGLLLGKLGLLKMICNHEFSPCKETTVPLKMTKRGLTLIPENGITLNMKKI